VTASNSRDSAKLGVRLDAWASLSLENNNDRDEPVRIFASHFGQELSSRLYCSEGARRLPGK
jgi:hypothetical protein